MQTYMHTYLRPFGGVGPDQKTHPEVLGDTENDSLVVFELLKWKKSEEKTHPKTLDPKALRTGTVFSISYMFSSWVQPHAIHGQSSQILSFLRYTMTNCSPYSKTGWLV